MNHHELLVNHKQSFGATEPKKKAPLTIIVNARSLEEVTVHCLADCSQRVAGLQSVVAIVDVCWVLKGQAALQIVLVEVHLSSNVVILQNLLLLVEPTQLRMRVTADCELNARIVALLWLGQPHNDWRNCTKEEKKFIFSKLILFVA